MKNKIWLSTFVAMLVFLTITTSCKKDKVDPIISWNNPADIIFGTALSEIQLNATASVAGTFVYTPASGTVLSVGDTQDLRVDFMPTDADNYNTASKTVTINVLKTDPVISWAIPADIIFGTALSEIQLNATINIAGTFVYTPAGGTVLSPGYAQDLKVDFTPTDTVSYNNASKTVKINVLNEIIFNPNLTYGSVTGQDGNVYKTIVIGTQTWMAENLRKSYGWLITDHNQWFYDNLGAYCWYENNQTAYGSTYGKLYNGNAIDNGMCPTGWHVPTNAEWITLMDYAGGESVAGGKLKEIGTTHWTSPNAGATNEFGFSALPGGMRFYVDGQYYGMGFEACFWSITTSNGNGCVIIINNDSVSMGLLTQSYFGNGYSVRCLKNN